MVKGFEELASIPELWVIVNVKDPKNQPAIDIHGVVYVMLDEGRKNEFLVSNKGDFGALSLSGEEFIKKYVIRLILLGAEGVRVFDANEDAAFGIQAENYLCTKLCERSIQYLQSASGWQKDTPNGKATTALFKQMALHELGKSLLFVPASYDGEDGKDIEDNEIHGFASVGNCVKGFGRNNGNLVVVYNDDSKDIIPATEAYNFATGNANRILHMQTIINQKAGGAYIPAFTSISELKMIFPKKRIALATMEDINKIKSTSPEVVGVVLNPCSFNFIIPENVSADGKSELAGILGGIIDGDATKTSCSAEQAPENKANQSKENKKGLFSKLFGKK